MVRFLLNLSHNKLLWTLCVLSVVGPLVAQTSQTSHTYPVIRVVDGDTVVLSLDGVKTRIRLIGIDTPETVHPQKPVEHYGQEASTFLKNLLRGESVSLEYEDGELVGGRQVNSIDRTWFSSQSWLALVKRRESGYERAARLNRLI